MDQGQTELWILGKKFFGFLWSMKGQLLNPLQKVQKLSLCQVSDEVLNLLTLRVVHSEN